MINLNLRGILGKKFGEKWNLEVRSVYEAFEAIQANCSGINPFFNKIEKFCSHFIVLINGKILRPHLLKSDILKKNDTVDILPIVQGGITVTAAIVLIAIGIVLIAAAIVLTKLMSPKVPKDVQTDSSILGGIRNVTNQNIVVPIGYGRLLVGSAVISSSIDSNYYSYINKIAVSKSNENDLNPNSKFGKDFEKLWNYRGRKVVWYDGLNDLEELRLD
jgi:predicted phage tail protein